jgi:phosphoribosyl-AMP cyclohydrolase
VSNVDETLELQLKFDVQGLIPAIICDTQSTGIVHFWSRSRNSLWKKGETSGETFAVQEIRLDCDQDVLQVMVVPQGKGNACHTGRRSCFYRVVEKDKLKFKN